MSELTPERIRDAAEVVDLLYGNTNLVVSAKNMRQVADRRDRQAKVDKRIEELAGKMRYAAITGDAGKHWESAAAWLLARYPSLLDETGATS